MRSVKVSKKTLVICGVVVAAIVLLLVAFVLLKGKQSDDKTTNGAQNSQSISSNTGTARGKESLCEYMHANKEPSGTKDTITYYKELEKRAPSDILQQVIAVRKGYEEIYKHPDRRLEITMDFNDADNEFTNWWSKNCQ